MKRLKVIGGFCYVISFFFAATLFLNINIGLTHTFVLYIFLSLGLIGFLLNLITYSKDKYGNPLSNLIYWLGSFFVFAGLVFKMLLFPFNLSIILIGAVLLFISLFIKRRPKSEDDDILDQL